MLKWLCPATSLSFSRQPERNVTDVFQNQKKIKIKKSSSKIIPEMLLLCRDRAFGAEPFPWAVGQLRIEK